jgi:hypothetical protein
LEELAVIFDDDDAFYCYGDGWKPMNIADAQCKARLLSKSDFDTMYSARHYFPRPTFQPG